MDMDQLKKQAAIQAVSFIKPDMVVGLGTGSTAYHAVQALADRMKAENFSVIGVPTSKRTATQAEQLGIPLATLEEQPSLDLAIDGADEIQLGTLNLIKGAGGALLREKLVECSAKQLIIIADESKKVEQLGTHFRVPVEVVRFGWKSTRSRISQLECQPELRKTEDGKPFITDEQHYILDCAFPPITDAETLGEQIKAIAGVVEHGLFVGMANLAIVAGSNGIETLSIEC